MVRFFLAGFTNFISKTRNLVMSNLTSITMFGGGKENEKFALREMWSEAHVGEGRATC